MNRVDRLKGVLWLEAVATAATAEAAKLRQELRHDAVNELDTNGSAVSWRFSGLGTVVLPVSSAAFMVSDPARFLEWAKQHHPTEVETVEKVREAWQKGLLTKLSTNGEAVFTADGTVVPGVSVRPGGVPKSLSITATPEAKEVFGHIAADGLKHAAVAAGPAVPGGLLEIEAEVTDG